MKTLKLSLGALLLSTIVFYSCEKEQTEVVDQNENRNQEVIFEAATTESEAANSELLNEILDGRHLDAQNEDRICCGVTSLTTNPAPFPPYFMNLNVKYNVGDADQALHVKHWVKIGGSWSYWGMSNIPFNLNICTAMNINMGVGGIPVGSVISWARTYDGDSGSYCGGSKVLFWVNP